MVVERGDVDRIGSSVEICEELLGKVLTLQNVRTLMEEVVGGKCMRANDDRSGEMGVG